MTDTQQKIQKDKNNPKDVQYSPLRLVGILTLIAFCTILLIVATFTRIKVINVLQPIVGMLHPEIFTTMQSIFTIKAYFYVPQIPIILFTAALLGGACTMTSVFVYIVIGLAFLPIFGLGGGFDYIIQPTFGYILAFLPASLVAGALIDKDYTLKSILKAAFFAVLTIHILGFFYMLLVSLLQHESLGYITDWLIFESFTKAFYDFIIGFLLMILAKFFRKFIWIITAT